MIINEKILSKFDVVNNDSLPESMLINRVDTKFFFEENYLDDILSSIYEAYSIIDYGHGLINNYFTEYFDTKDFLFYKHHHNRKNKRLKLRFRSYVNSEIDYFEVKKKIYKRTVKERKKIEKEFLDDNLELFRIKRNIEDEIETKLFTKFNRITFVNNDKSERVTLDFNLEFLIDEKNVKLPNIIILELKQERLNRTSKLFKILRDKNIRKSKFSKYFVGVNLLYSDIKSNSFKETKLKMNKFKIKEI